MGRRKLTVWIDVCIIMSGVGDLPCFPTVYLVSRGQTPFFLFSFGREKRVWSGSNTRTRSQNSGCG